jgi:hypothetical protein
MTQARLVRREDFESTVLREAADKLNFIYRLAVAYRAPELLRFLETLARSLEQARVRLEADRSARS